MLLRLKESTFTSKLIVDWCISSTRQATTKNLYCFGRSWNLGWLDGWNSQEQYEMPSLDSLRCMIVLLPGDQEYYEIMETNNDEYSISSDY